MERRVVTPDLAGLRALSHPGRLRMLGLLRSDGPTTATALAHRLGLNSGATSYHLRQLEKHGFVVEDVDRGNGRERWWRASHQSTRTSEAEMAELAAPEAHETYDAYFSAVAQLQHERLQRSLEERPLLPQEWRAVGDLSNWTLHLTPSRADALIEQVHALVEAYAEDPPEAAGAAPYVVNLTGYVQPGIGPEEQEQ